MARTLTDNLVELRWRGCHTRPRCEQQSAASLAAEGLVPDRPRRARGLEGESGDPAQAPGAVPAVSVLPQGLIVPRFATHLPIPP